MKMRIQFRGYEAIAIDTDNDEDVLIFEGIDDVDESRRILLQAARSICAEPNPDGWIPGLTDLGEEFQVLPEHWIPEPEAPQEVV